MQRAAWRDCLEVQHAVGLTRDRHAQVASVRAPLVERRLLGSDLLGEVSHRIVSITGFVPIVPPLDFLSPSTSGSVSDRTLFAFVDSKNGQHAENETDTRQD